MTKYKARKKERSKPAYEYSYSGKKYKYPSGKSLEEQLCSKLIYAGIFISKIDEYEISSRISTREAVQLLTLKRELLILFASQRLLEFKCIFNIDKVIEMIESRQSRPSVITTKKIIVACRSDNYNDFLTITNNIIDPINHPLIRKSHVPIEEPEPIKEPEQIEEPIIETQDNVPKTLAYYQQNLYNLSQCNLRLMFCPCGCGGYYHLNNVNPPY